MLCWGMKSETQQRIQQHALWLSLMVHALFLASLVAFVRLTPPSVPPRLPASISAYAAATPLSAAPTTPAVAQPQPSTKPALKAPKAPNKRPDAIVLQPIKPTPKAAPSPRSLKPQPVHFSGPRQLINLTHAFDREPLQLVGEDKIVPPLVRLLASAISPHLFYPRVAAEFNLQGVVFVGFVLHPEGYITGVRVVKSSGAGVLDDAARQGVGAANSIGNVSQYVSQPEFLVVGIIFG